MISGSLSKRYPLTIDSLIEPGTDELRIVLVAGSSGNSVAREKHL